MPPESSHSGPSGRHDGKAADLDGETDEPNPEVGEQATPDDIPRPKGLVNFSQAPFGTLCGLFDVLESASREGHKKPGYKGNLIAKFFAVSQSDWCRPELRTLNIASRDL